MKACESCGRQIELAATGRPKRFCGQTCRKRASRESQASPFPVALTSRRAWVRAQGKRPIQVDGSPASCTDPETWASFTAVQSGAGDGFGIMLGDGLGCLDVDHATDEQIRQVVASTPERILFVERSMSGDGAHIFIEADEERGWRRFAGGVHLERYSRQRFIRTTGDVIRF